MTFYISRFKGMESQEFEVEIVTPLFLGGADPNKAELRAPSIKGSLRFWWRAFNPHFSLRDLKKNEAEIFGDAGDSNNSFGKSRVRINLVKDLRFENMRYNPVPHKQVKFKFPCFSPGNKFALKVYGDENIFNLFKLFSIVGGLGKRSRRGFGSVMINKINGEAFSFDYSTKAFFSLIKSVADNNYKIDNKRIVSTGFVHSESKYAYVKSIEFGQKSFDNHEAILKTIGQSSHNNKSDYTGYAGKGQERFSSPIYVSVIQDGKKYTPVITTLNTAFKNAAQKHGTDKSMQFKKDILSGGSQ